MEQKSKLIFNAEKFSADSLAYRSEKKLSREKLAELLSITASIIRHYENKVTPPPANILQSYCELMGKNVSDYFENDKE